MADPQQLGISIKDQYPTASGIDNGIAYQTMPDGTRKNLGPVKGLEGDDPFAGSYVSDHQDPFAGSYVTDAAPKLADDPFAGAYVAPSAAAKPPIDPRKATTPQQLGLPNPAAQAKQQIMTASPLTRDRGYAPIDVERQREAAQIKSILGDAGYVTPEQAKQGIGTGLLVGGALIDPTGTAAGIVGGELTGAALKKGAQAAGRPEGEAEMWGTTGNIVGGLVGGKFGADIDPIVRNSILSRVAPETALRTTGALRDNAANVLEYRLAEHNRAMDAAHAAEQDAAIARINERSGLGTREQTIAAEERASAAQANVNKSGKGVTEAWKTHSDAMQEANRVKDVVTRRQNLRMQQNNTKANAMFRRIAPPTKSNAGAYTEEDLNAIRPFIRKYANAEVPEGTVLAEQQPDQLHRLDLILERVKGDIDGQFKPQIQQYAREPITTNVTHDVQTELEKSTDASFVRRGMKALENYNLIDPTMEESDQILTDLNAKLRSTLESNPRMKTATLLRSDPVFAARYHAAESLRNGIHGNLEGHGVAGTRTIRDAQRAAIKIQNAVQHNIDHGEAPVRPGGPEERLGKEAQKNGPTRNNMLSKFFKVDAGDPVQVTGSGTPAIVPHDDTPPPVDPNALSWQDMHKINQEYGDLHSALASHFHSPDESFGPLESRFLLSTEVKLNQGQELSPAEQGLYDQITQARFDAKKQFSKAMVQLGPTPDPTLPSNIEPHMFIPGKMQEGMDSVKGITHEYAHTAVTNELLGDKLPPNGIISHNHGMAHEANAMAGVSYDWSYFQDENGVWDPKKIADNLEELAASYFAGAVANDLYHDVPIHFNKHLGADKAGFNRLADIAGVSPATRDAAIRKGITSASEILGRPGTEDVLTAHSEVRDANTSDIWHATPERIDQVNEDLQRRWEYEQKKHDLARGTGESGGVSKQGASDRGREGASRKPKGSNKASVRKDGGAKSEGRKGTGENNPNPQLAASATDVEPELVYRARPIGEQGVPAKRRPVATSSLDEAQRYAKSLEEMTGKPHEVVQFPLKGQKYESAPGPNEGTHWITIKEPVSEEIVKKGAKPAE